VSPRARVAVLALLAGAASALAREPGITCLASAGGVSGMVTREIDADAAGARVWERALPGAHEIEWQRVNPALQKRSVQATLPVSPVLWKRKSFPLTSTP
jgi:hypothetical protein